ncbi:Bancal [Operophtera brumata]|uniref:Bancal n=1 Tax=Operophtera brumata TaxID=104452 RepID=A0A0L7L668_OPEBR|nr:Bancal [Operophtera brumata]
MKRDAYGDDGPTQKRYRQPDDEVTFLIPSKGGSSREGGYNQGNDDEDLDVRLLIHQSRAGCVIGKGGAKIKELREMARAFNKM